MHRSPARPAARSASMRSPQGSEDRVTEVHVDRNEGEAADMAQARAYVRRLSNDALIVTLINTLNHLSRWLTPIHDHTLLAYATRRSERSVRDVLLEMRETDTRVYALMYAI